MSQNISSVKNERCMPAARSGDLNQRFVSFDYLRLFAIVMVTLQHGMAVAGHYEQTTWLNINLGQVGVGLFCALSGYLAFIKGAIPATTWLQKRLWQIYPAYCIVTVIAFLLTWIAGTKHIDWFLFMSQMMGTGYFTHGWDLINVVSWFISLILFCYVIAFIGKWLQRPRLVLCIVSIITLALLATHSEVSLSRHVLTFCVAGLVAQISFRPAVMLAIAIGLTGTSMLWPQCFYAAFSITILILALAWRVPESKLASAFSSHVYEYFLVHGIFLVALARLLPKDKVLSSAIAVLLSIITAVFLKKLTERVIRFIRVTDSYQRAIG